MVFGFNETNISQLQHYRMLNVFENKIRDSYYRSARLDAENILFKNDSAPLPREEARPRYAGLHIGDYQYPIESPSNFYGKSFVTFKDIVKFNCLFIPQDSMNQVLRYFIPCSVHYLNLLLYQCDDTKLRNIATRVALGNTYLNLSSTKPMT